MADSTTTISGNITRDPDLSYTPGGHPLLKLSVAVNRKWKKGDEWQEETSFFNTVAWGDLAENASASLQKGNRVVVVGRLQQRSWETESDEKRSVVEIVADDIALSTRYATAQATKVTRERQVLNKDLQPQPPEADFFSHAEPF